jgi:hypothetical protein
MGILDCCGLGERPEATVIVSGLAAFGKTIISWLRQQC